VRVLVFGLAAAWSATRVVRGCRAENGGGRELRDGDVIGMAAQPVGTERDDDLRPRALQITSDPGNRNGRISNRSNSPST
jgi:hypothetical protein